MNFYLNMASTYATPTHGMTLVETLTVVAIVSIVLSIAAPSFRQWQENWEVMRTTQSLERTLMLARSEAIRQGGRIGLRKNNSSTSCRNADTNQEWGCGWFIYADLDGNGSWKSSEPKLHDIQLSGNVNVMHTSGGINIKFDRYGMASGLNAKGFTLSPARTGISSTATRTLCMSSGGRIRIVQDASCPKS